MVFGSAQTVTQGATVPRGHRQITYLTEWKPAATSSIPKSSPNRQPEDDCWHQNADCTAARKLPFGQDVHLAGRWRIRQLRFFTATTDTPMDIASHYGTAIRAAAAGTWWSRATTALRQTYHTRPRQRLLTVYAHNSSLYVQVGDKVQQGSSSPHGDEPAAQPETICTLRSH
jgi:murein DD-endopeptidase MepM/ murein hydrolase activator NlpD